MTARCANCRYFSQVEATTRIKPGECRCDAPVPRPGDRTKRAVWPIVKPDHWCGRFCPRDPQEAAQEAAEAVRARRRYSPTPTGLTAALRALIDPAWDVTILPTSAGPVAEAIGWYGGDRIYLRRETFRAAVYETLDVHKAAAMLWRAGCLVASDVDRNRYVRYVPGGVGKMDAYALSRVRFRAN